MKTLPDTFTINFLGSPILVTQVENIDSNDDQDKQIAGTYITNSKEILICSKLSEIQKYLVLFNCLGSLAEETFKNNNPQNKESIPSQFITQFTFTILAALVSSQSINVSSTEFNNFFMKNIRFIDPPN